MLCSALSTAFSPLTPIAPPADVLMLSQPALSGPHLTLGITGAGSMAARRDAGATLRSVGARIACGPDSPAAAFGLAATPLDDEDVVEAVVDGPLSSEQPLAQPVAAGPTNVGEDGP